MEREGRSAGAGDTPKDGPQHEPRTAGVIVVKDATGNLSGSIKARDRRTIAVQHCCRSIRQHTAVGEGDATAHTVRHKRRRVQAQGPVGLDGCDALSTFAVLDGRIEGPVLDRGIIGGDGTDQRRRG